MVFIRFKIVCVTILIPFTATRQEPYSKGIRKVRRLSDSECWMNIGAAKHFQIMDELDNKFANARNKFQETAKKLDEKLLFHILRYDRGVALRALFNAGGNLALIPAGLHLGGYAMMKMPESLLFFHRMKLRNDTVFRVQLLEHDLTNMTLKMRLNLHDLHLKGAYERAPIYKDPSTLHYVPNFGEIEMLLKNVGYKMEARLRLPDEKLFIEVVDSDLILEDEILMSYLHSNNPSPVPLRKENIQDFLERMKTDLDLWLRDLINDFYIYNIFDINPEFQDYEKARVIALNNYADYAIDLIKQRIKDQVAGEAKIPSYNLLAVPNTLLKLTNGVLRGLDTIHRRSVATGKRENDVRYIDMIVGFSSLKAEYRFNVRVPTGYPPLLGNFLLTADDITAHLQIAMVQEPESIDFKFDHMRKLHPEALTVEGSGNRLIANFKHMLETHVGTLMSNGVIHNIKMLSTLTRCRPKLFSNKAPFLRNYEERLSELRFNKEIGITADNNQKIVPKQLYGEKPKNLLSNKARPSNNNDVEPTVTDNNEYTKKETLLKQSGSVKLRTALEPLATPIKENDNNVKAEAELDETDKTADYILLNNDSVEIETPNNSTGEKQKMKLKHEEKFTITKVQYIPESAPESDYESKMSTEDFPSKAPLDQAVKSQDLEVSKLAEPLNNKINEANAELNSADQNADYILINNDSVEIETPNNVTGKNQKMKLEHKEKFTISKIDYDINKKNQ